MPMNRKPRGGMRRPAYKPKGKAGVSQAVKKYVKKVASKTRPEMKCQRFAFTENSLLNTGAIATSFYWNEFPAISQGVTRDSRIGNEIYLHGYHAKGSYFNNGSSPVFIRRLVVGYSTGVAANSVASELFDLSTGVGTTLTTVGNNMGLITTRINKSQFKVYFDKVIKLSPTSATDGTQTKLYNYFQKFGGKKITYEANAVGANNQDARLAEIYLVAQADNDASTGFVVEQTLNNAIYFTDP